jgi:site-specific DNA-methyltransferase (adenine-specific)
MTARLFHGDCLEEMKKLPDKSIDCFICDLPYGQLHPGRKEQDEAKWWDRPINGCPWDIKIDLKAFWEQVERLAKEDNTPVIHFCNTKFGIDLINSKPNWFRYDLVWNKERGVSFLSANKMPMKSHEMIYIFSKKGAFYNRVDIDDINKKADRQYFSDITNTTRSHNVYPSSTLTRSKGCPDGKRCSLSVISIKKVGTCKNLHPTEKPKELYEWLLRRYCPAEGTILDPTAGSFNSVSVALSLGMNAIGIEKDEGFFNKGFEMLCKESE